MANSTLAAGVVNAAYTQGIISTVNEAGAHHAGVLTAVGSTTLSGDPRVLGFKHRGADRALIVSYTFGQPGTAVFGIYAPTEPGSPTAWQLIGTTHTSAEWGFSNPYGLVIQAGSDELFVQDYDSGRITALNLTNNTVRTVYTFVPTSGYNAHGNGLDYYDGHLVALFSQASDSFVYTSSALVQITTGGTQVGGRVYLNYNAVSLTVEENFAYVSTIGGWQNPGGNGVNSQLQVVDLDEHALVASIPAVTAPSTAGDFLDVAFAEGHAYVLLAHFNADFTQYNYRLIRTTAEALQEGNFGDYTTTTATTPAGATWLLAPDHGLLWFVSADVANTVTAGPLAAGSVVVKATSAQLGVGAINAHLNTAAVVIERPGISAFKAAGVSAARTKSALRLTRQAEREEK